jgi:hypothetical protein
MAAPRTLAAPRFTVDGPPSESPMALELAERRAAEAARAGRARVALDVIAAIAGLARADRLAPVDAVARIGAILGDPVLFAPAIAAEAPRDDLGRALDVLAERAEALAFALGPTHPMLRARVTAEPAVSEPRYVPVARVAPRPLPPPNPPPARAPQPPPQPPQPPKVDDGILARRRREVAEARERAERSAPAPAAVAAPPVPPAAPVAPAPPAAAVPLLDEPSRLDYLARKLAAKIAQKEAALVGAGPGGVGPGR